MDDDEDEMISSLLSLYHKGQYRGTHSHTHRQQRQPRVPVLEK